GAAETPVEAGWTRRRRSTAAGRQAVGAEGVEEEPDGEVARQEETLGVLQWAQPLVRAECCGGLDPGTIGTDDPPIDTASEWSAQRRAARCCLRRCDRRELHLPARRRQVARQRQIRLARGAPRAAGGRPHPRSGAADGGLA